MGGDLIGGWASGLTGSFIDVSTGRFRGILTMNGLRIKETVPESDL